MKNVELYGRVRYAVQIEGLSERAVARRFGLDPRTVSKMMKFSVPPGWDLQPPRHISTLPNRYRIGAWQRTSKGANNCLMHRSKIRGRLCGPFNPRIDFAAEHSEVYWFCQQRLSAVLQSFALCLRIA
jgi:hypothetical protein